MRIYSNVLIFALVFTINFSLLGQENKIIEIRKAGGSRKDQQTYPGANILFKDSIVFDADNTKPAIAG